MASIPAAVDESELVNSMRKSPHIRSHRRERKGDLGSICCTSAWANTIHLNYVFSFELEKKNFFFLFKAAYPVCQRFIK